jgi:hypothetical protein
MAWHRPQGIILGGVTIGGYRMRTITLDVPDELADQLSLDRDRLPELLALSLRQPAVPAQIYRAIVTFLAGDRAPDEVAAFGPTPEMHQRLQLLLGRERTSALTPAERAELDEFERIEHLMVMIKAHLLSPRRQRE